MGFLDKAKKLAEQAQTKLDEVQGQINSNPARPGTSSSGPITEYDKHGRPVPPAATMGSTPPPAPPEAPVTPGVPPTGSPATAPVEAAPSAPPPAPTPGVPPVDEDRNHPSYAPPPLTSGDPLAG
jgi:formin 2/WAS/WASL-interacting protein